MDPTESGGNKGSDKLRKAARFIQLGHHLMAKSRYGKIGHLSTCATVVFLKSPMLRECLLLTDGDVDNLERADCLSDEDIAKLRKTPTNRRTTALIECLDECPSEDGLELVCRALHVAHRRVVLELRQELLIAKGQLELPESDLLDAGKVVHRKMGSSKRWSEYEKKTEQNLIAERVRLAKFVWRRELEALRDEVSAATRRNQDGEIYAQELKDKFADFIKTFSGLLGSSTAPNGAKRASWEPDAGLQQETEYMMGLALQGLLEMEDLMQSRARVCKMLDIPCENGELDLVLEKAIREMVRKQTQNDGKAHRLTKKNMELGVDMDSYDRGVRGVLADLSNKCSANEKELNAKMAEISELSRGNLQLRHLLKKTRQGIDDFRHKFVVLDRSKRLNGYYDKFGDGRSRAPHSKPRKRDTKEYASVQHHTPNSYTSSRASQCRHDEEEEDEDGDDDEDRGRMSDVIGSSYGVHGTRLSTHFRESSKLPDMYNRTSKASRIWK